MEMKQSLYECFPMELKKSLFTWFQPKHQLQEIRMRVNKPLILYCDGEEFSIDGQGLRVQEMRDAKIIVAKEIQDTLSYVSDYSLYAYEEEIRQGFLTTKDGCRIGICGKVIVENGMIKNIHPISSLNIRFPHEVKGSSSPIIPYIIEKKQVLPTLIISPPMCGKTTILRDLVRQISNGNCLEEKWNGKTVGVVDERGELSACHFGVPQNDLGIRTDILDSCPKAKGMMMLVRTMSPQVIAVDEIGSEEELKAMYYGMNCGCSILATAHSSSLEEFQKKFVFQQVKERQLFKRYVVLSNRFGSGTIEDIYDQDGKHIGHIGRRGKHG